jgi:hypothetical protein
VVLRERSTSRLNGGVSSEATGHAIPGNWDNFNLPGQEQKVKSSSRFLKENGRVRSPMVDEALKSSFTATYDLL